MNGGLYSVQGVLKALGGFMSCYNNKHEQNYKKKFKWVLEVY